MIQLLFNLYSGSMFITILFLLVAGLLFIIFAMDQPTRRKRITMTVIGFSLVGIASLIVVYAANALAGD
jgi:hypothetical protein